MVGLLMTGVLLAGVAGKFNAPPQQNTDWKQELIEQNQQLNTEIHDGKMPDAMKRQLTVQVKKNEYAIEHDISPQRETGWDFAQSMSAMISLVTILTVIVAGDSIASEFSWGTIKLLLIRPVSRTKILISKYISTLGFALLLLLILFIWSAIVGAALFGVAADQPYIYADKAGTVHEGSIITHVLTTYGMQSVSLLMIVTFAFMISAIFRSSSLSIGLSIFLLFTGTTAVQLLSKYGWAKYILFANLDLRQYFDGMPLIEGMTLGFSLIVLAVYFVVFQLAAWLLFTKRDVAA